MSKIACMIIAAGVVGLAAPAMAADGQAACRADAPKVCPSEYAARDKGAVKACLIKNIDKVSADCRAFLNAQGKAGATGQR